MQNNKFNQKVEQWLKNCREDSAWQERATDLLVRMVAVDTTPQSDPAKLAQAEAAVFDIIEEHLKASGTISKLEVVPISTQIAGHPYYSIPYYAGEEIANQPTAEQVKTVYQGRSNRIARIGSQDKPVLAFNAHIDVVPPYIAPRREGDIVYGRGSCDDKGACVAMILAAEWLEAIRRKFDIEPAWQVLLQFVIEEEMGGNGSLSLALDKERAGFDSIVVLECTGLGMHPGNRGAVWYKVTLESEELDNSEMLEAASLVVGALDRTGKQLKAESDHPLFPTRPVQTCHGRMGGFGEHPSRVHDSVSLLLSSQAGLPNDLQGEVDSALQSYCAEYGDKTIPGVGDGLLEKHLEWTEIDPTTVRLELFGLSGHMGATERLDGAITKAAWIVRHLMKIRKEREGNWKTLRFSLEEDPASELILEGGQGFVPTHCLEEVCERMRVAVSEGVAEYARFMDLTARISGRKSLSINYITIHTPARRMARCFRHYASMVAMRGFRLRKRYRVGMSRAMRAFLLENILTLK